MDCEKHCTAGKRKLVLKWGRKGKFLIELQNFCIAHCALKHIEKTENRGGKDKSLIRNGRRILRLCKVKPFKSAIQKRIWYRIWGIQNRNHCQSKATQRGNSAIHKNNVLTV